VAVIPVKTTRVSHAFLLDRIVPTRASVVEMLLRVAKITVIPVSVLTCTAIVPNNVAVKDRPVPTQDIASPAPKRVIPATATVHPNVVRETILAKDTRARHVRKLAVIALIRACVAQRIHLAKATRVVPVTLRAGTVPERVSAAV